MHNFRNFTQIMYSFGNLDYSKCLNNCSQVEYIVLLKIEEYLEENKTNFVNVTKLSELLNVSTPAVSRVLKSLESKKYIARNIDVFCRRNTKIKITELGKTGIQESDVIDIENRSTGVHCNLTTFPYLSNIAVLNAGVGVQQQLG